MDAILNPLKETAADESGLLLISSNADAFAVRQLTAREAQHSLDLMYYIWHDDHCGKALLNEVVDAARRGVKVRLLIDDINPHANDATYLALDDSPNIEVRLFNPSHARSRAFLRRFELVARMRALNRRMHLKAWIADHRLAIIGGRNVGDEYFDAADTNFRDLDLLVEGAAAQEACAIFETYWAHEAAVPVRALHPMRKRRRRFFKKHPDMGGTPRRVEASSVAELVDASGGMKRGGSARVIADPPEKVMEKLKGNWLMGQIAPLIRAAKTRVVIVSPYFIPGKQGVAILAGLVGEGVDATVLTNSLAATDVAAVHGAYANYRRKLLKKGVRLYELQRYGDRTRISMFGSKGASLHTKAFAVDGETGFVGSLNFDPRSAALNAEMGVIFDDPELVGQLVDLIDKERSRRTSYRLFLDGRRLLWEGYRDGELTQFRSEPEAGLWRRVIAGVIRYLPVESQL